MKMVNDIINDDFKALVENIKISYKGSSLNPFKFYKNVESKQIPVYFIGTPGLFVAITATCLAVIFMILFNMKLSMFIWLLILIVSAIVLRIALKIDKARQIRMFSSDMILKSY
ncbi:MAG: hypothetical protein K6348_00670, partial [Deferribacterales bacterium]